MPLPPELPPIVTSAKYISVYDEYGSHKVIELPVGKAIFIFNGTDAEWGGSAAVNVSGAGNLLPDDGILTGVVVADGAGDLKRVNVPPVDNVLYFLTIENKFPAFGTLGNILPSGHGLMVRTATPSNASPSYLAGTASVYGVIMANADGTISIVNVKDIPNGRVLTTTDSGPQFVSPSGAQAASAAGATGLNDVLSNSVTTTTIHLTCPRLSLTSTDGSQQDAVLVDAVLDIATTGALGLDVAGGVSASHFYYLYVIAKDDGTLSLTASLNASTPVLPSGYTFWGFAGLFYAKADATIRQYIQQGKRFWIEDTIHATNVPIATTWAAVGGEIALASILPPIVKTASGKMGGGSAETGQRRYAVGSTIGGLAAQGNSMGSTAGVAWQGLFFSIYSFRDLPIMVPNVPVIYWQASAAVSGNRERLIVTGFTI